MQAVMYAPRAGSFGDWWAEMDTYAPKLHHAMITAVICIVLIALCEKAEGKVLDALITGAIIFGLITVLILWGICLEMGNRRAEVMTEWMEAFGKLDEEARAAVAFEFPTVRYHMKRGEVRQMFEDTNVSIELFRLFLQTSNNRYISPERDWNSKEKPRWVWLEIKQWLEDHDSILADSAAGSHSWLWNGNSYKHLYAYWMAGRKMVSTGEESRAYAYEEQA
jgi:hypothetical protein